MFKKFNILLILLLLFISVAAVSAADDIDMNLTSNDDNMELEDVSLDDNSDEILSSSEYSVNNDNYGTYFDDNGNLKDNVKSGDTIKLSDSFSNKNFIFNKTVNVIGDSSYKMSNSIFTFLNGASGSSVSKLTIENTVDEAYGIFLNGAKNCVITGCTIVNQGRSSYPICLGNDASYNNVTDNYLKTSGAYYSHGSRSTSALLISGSHYNYVANNHIEVEDANGIYLSSYDGGPLKGGVSNFNTIYNNTIHYNVLPTSWSYGIQIMGGNNSIKYNTVNGAYRGISTISSGNIIIGNKIINLIGADYNQKDVATGGDYAIVASYNSIVLNNSIINATIIGSGAAISAVDNSIIENNDIEVKGDGKGISANGFDVVIKNNRINTTTGAGVYQKDEVSGLTIIDNTIISGSGVGVLIEKLSSKRMPSNITITDNYIRTGNEYAIDARGADSSSLYKIENNDVNKKVADPAGTFDPSKPTYIFNGAVYNITEENFKDYIDPSGSLKNNIVDGDILNFIGEFRNHTILVNQKVKITGNNPVFYNCSFKITSGGVLIENLKIINKKSPNANAWGIFVNAVPGAKILNNTIEVNDPNAAYAIYILNSNDIEVLNNKLTSSGYYLTFTLLIYASEDCIVKGNEIYTSGTNIIQNNFTSQYCIDGQEVCIDGQVCLDGQESCIDGNEFCIDGSELCVDGNEFCLDGGHVVPEIFKTYGILMLYSSGNNVTGNKVNVTSKLNKTYDVIGENSSINSIVGIDAYYNTHNNIFSNNDVFVKGYDNYIYGMGVLGYYTGHSASQGQGASNNKFINNNIVLEGTYFTEGFVIGSSTDNTLIQNNTVKAKSNNVTYGINLEMSQKSNIVDNNFALDANAAYGIEAVESNNNIVENNVISANGKQVYGMAFSGSSNNEIISNDIVSNGTGEDIPISLDAIGTGNAGVYISGNSTNNNLKSNNITSQKGYAIDSKSTGNNFEDNYLVSEKGYANDAINGTAGNTVTDNYIYLINATFPDITGVYLEETTFTLYVNSTLDGAIVEFYSDPYFIGEAVVKDGVATFKTVLDDEFKPATYQISAIISKENYKTTKVLSYLSVTNGNLNVVVNNMSVKPGLNAKYEVKVTNALGNPVSGLTVNFRYFSSTSQIAFSGKTDSNGLLTISNILDKSYSTLDSVEVFVEVAESDYYLSGQAVSNINILNVAPVSININSKVGFNGVLATLTDNNGFVVANKDVTVNMDNIAYNVRTNANGEVILPSLSAGFKSITVSSAKDSNYDSASANAMVSVIAAISGNADANVYFGNTVQYKIRLADRNGNYLGANNDVAIKVNGNIVGLKTDADGYVTYTFKNVGTYTITAEYNGQSVSNKIIIKPTLTAKNIVKKKAKKIKFSAKLVDKNGKVLKKKKVTFKVKNKKYKAKTNKKGVATITLKNLKVGKYTVKTSYGGCTIKNTIKVKK